MNRKARKTISLFIIIILTPMLISCTSSPSDDLVRKDWENHLSEDKKSIMPCSKYLRFTGLDISGKSVEGNNAVVIIKAKGDWISNSDPGFFGGPCKGFKKRKGNNQLVERKMFYRKYDTGWRLENIR